MTANMGSTNGDILVTPANSCSAGSTRKLAVAFPCRVVNGVFEEIENSDNFSIKLFPSPAHDLVRINFNTQTASGFVIELMDLMGKTVLKYQGTTQEGRNEVKLNLGKIPPGIYLINLRAGEENKYIKLQIN